MNLITTSWACQRCGAACICDPALAPAVRPVPDRPAGPRPQHLPEHRRLPVLRRAGLPGLRRRHAAAGPGPRPARRPVAAHLAKLLISYRTVHEKVTGDER